MTLIWWALEACPLSDWLYRHLIAAGFKTVRAEPLRGGLRQSPLDALTAHGPGRKALLQAERKACSGLQTQPRLKEETALNRTEK